MSYEAKLYTRLSGTGAVNTVVGTRVYPSKTAPQDAAVPFVAYEQIDGDTEYSLGSVAGSIRYIVRLHLVTNTYAQMVTLKAAVRTRLAGWTDFTAGTTIESAMIDRETDSIGAMKTGTDEPVIYSQQDWILWAKA